MTKLGESVFTPPFTHLPLLVAACGLEMMLNTLGHGLLAEIGESLTTRIDDPTTEKSMPPLLVRFKHLWADSGDLISLHYAGTGATTSKASKEG